MRNPPTFLNYSSNKAMGIYFSALLLVSMLFFKKVMPFTFWAFGIISVCSFFIFSKLWFNNWRYISEKKFTKKIFLYALCIRLIWSVFYYFYIFSVSENYFSFGDPADALHYHLVAQWHSEISSFTEIWGSLVDYWKGISDVGYSLYLTYIYKLFGDGLLLPRLFKAIYGAFTAVLIYKLATRNFGEQVGRMAGIFCVLMPNLILYTGFHLKEVEMVTLTVWFVERADYLIRTKKYTVFTILPPLLLAGSLFLFRTVLGATALFSFFTTLVFSSTKVIGWPKRIMIGTWVLLTVTYFFGGRIATEVEEILALSSSNQANSMEYRATRKGGNEFAKYASGAVFAPLIFAIPFPTMVNIEHQKTQQMFHGGNYVKNVLAFFVIIAFYYLIKIKKWRDYLLLISFTVGYLGIIAMSAFAQSERFHQPIIPFLMVFAAFGISIMNNRFKKYFSYYMIFLFIIIIGWSWFKLAGRGMI